MVFWHQKRWSYLKEGKHRLYDKNCIDYMTSWMPRKLLTVIQFKSLWALPVLIRMNFCLWCCCPCYHSHLSVTWATLTLFSTKHITFVSVLPLIITQEHAEPSAFSWPHCFLWVHFHSSTSSHMELSSLLASSLLLVTERRLYCMPNAATVPSV